MSDISKNYISSREAATITGVHIATIRRMCKKLLKSSDPAMREMCQKKYEEGSEKFEYMIDKDFALNKWKNPETYSAPTSNSNAPQSSTDRALDIMEKVVSSLVEQNKELKEQNKKFYELISEMSRRGFFLDAPKQAGADINGQAATVIPNQPFHQETVQVQPVAEEKPKKGFWSRVFGG